MTKAELIEIYFQIGFLMKKIRFNCSRLQLTFWDSNLPPTFIIINIQQLNGNFSKQELDAKSTHPLSFASNWTLCGGMMKLII